MRRVLFICGYVLAKVHFDNDPNLFMMYAECLALRAIVDHIYFIDRL